MVKETEQTDKNEWNGIIITLEDAFWDLNKIEKRYFAKDKRFQEMLGAIKN